jgi:hypothetical protein
VALQQTFKDAAYIGIGIGVLTFQRAQVLRRDLEKQVKHQLGDRNDRIAKGKDLVTSNVKDVQGRLQNIGDRVEERIDPVLDKVTERLPEPARDAFSTARSRVKDARRQLASAVA